MAELNLEKLAEYRKESGLSMEEVADKAGLSVSSVSRIYNGVTTNPSIDTLLSIVISTGGSMDVVCGIATATPPDGFTQLDLDVLKVFAKSQNRTQAALQTHIHSLQRVLRLSMTANVLFVCLIIFVLIFDITHPTMGWVQYTVQAVTTAADSLKTMFSL